MDAVRTSHGHRVPGTVKARRVLIIDDDDLVAVALYEHLIANAIDVDLATEPLRAEELMRSTQYSLIVMDAYLTGLLHDRAAELLERVRAMSPESQIILLSAYGSEHLGRAVSRLRDITVFPKPQSVVHLTEVIDGFVQHGTLPQSRASA